MRKKDLFRFKNEMILANFLANFIAVFFVGTLIAIAELASLDDIHPFISTFDMLFTPFAFIGIGVLTLLYEKPVRQCIPALLDQKPVDPDLLHTAQRRILNEPYVLMLMDLCVWSLAVVLYPTMFWVFDSGTDYIHRALYISISIGCITVIVAFFLLEHLLQKRYAPLFFPDGGMDRVPGTLRIKIRTRLGALLFASNLVPLFSILDLVFRMTAKDDQPAEAIKQLQVAVTVNTLIFLAVGVILTVLVSRNLTAPLKEIVRALKNIKKGNFDSRVRVMSNDEIGYTGEIINEMTEGLKERDHLRESLKLAMEVQQNLMPKTDPVVDGIEIAGTSIYCEQTGGDYYDYIVKGTHGRGKIGVLVGDVSGHGIPSALLMISGRAFLRQRATMAGDLAQIVSDVNKEICRDVEASGRFMTLFFCEIDRMEKSITWVNAGHEPAFIYHPDLDSFEELKGGGLPLGVFEDTRYRKQVTPLAKGRIVIIGTDGIWECRNPDGEMYGKQRFKEIIRELSPTSASHMISQVIRSLEAFRGSAGREDDITLVIAKIMV
ncbi:MAG: PP2C family protein-serine/threonine phosphatase [Desulfobacteraceae bacterium]|nr:PP2C family protein-serine/threonine phosphatase [Desulfobacteraceae bacterium]